MRERISHRAVREGGGERTHLLNDEHGPRKLEQAHYDGAIVNGTNLVLLLAVV
jgi:hypothetical protein